MDVVEYKVVVTVGDRSTEIRDKVETNYAEGEAYQVAELFYRAMLANGFSPSVSANALVKAAANGGFVMMHALDIDDSGGSSLEKSV